MTAGAVIEVFGLPYPKGSMSATNRHGFAQVLDGSSDKARALLKDWQTAVRAAAVEWMYVHQDGLFTGPLRVVVEFRFPPIKSEPDRHFHAVKPDADKLLRSTLDALVRAGLLKDDALVCDPHPSKRYCWPGEEPGARIVVVSLAAVEELKRRERKRLRVAATKAARLRALAEVPPATEERTA